MNSQSICGPDQQAAYGPAPEVIWSVSSSPKWGQKTAADPALVAIVDDDPAVLKSLLRLVKSSGCRVEGFASAEDFLQSASYAGTACVILDLSLPGMSGLELQRWLTAERNGVPIVFVSAHDEPETRAQALGGGAVAFLGKPVDDRALLDAVQSALNR